MAGQAYRWGTVPAPPAPRRSNADGQRRCASSAIAGDDFGYPVCTVCGQSVSPLSSARQHQEFEKSHRERCGRAPRPIGFHADVLADAFSLPSAVTMRGDRLQRDGGTAVRRGARSRHAHGGSPDSRDRVTSTEKRSPALLWDPMPGGSGLLERMCERFDEVVAVAREVVEDCPGVLRVVMHSTACRPSATRTTTTDCSENARVGAARRMGGAS